MADVERWFETTLKDLLIHALTPGEDEPVEEHRIAKLQSAYGLIRKGQLHLDFTHA
jgi:hypothetical protein